MENTKTVNVISTPNINGNIGSCETKSINSVTSKGYIEEGHHVVMTNSCTGQIIKEYDYVDKTGYVAFGFVALVVLAIFIGISISAYLDKGDSYSY